MRLGYLAFVLAGTAALSACGDKPQTLGGNRNDVAPFQGASNPYVVSGWKAGDKVSWEQALKARTQNTQNEYTRTAPTK